MVALTWLGNHIWESENNPTIPLKTLYSLVKPGSISGEAHAIHQTVLNITAQGLAEQLKDVRNRHSGQSSDIKPILDALEPYTSFQHNGSCDRSELESWTAHSSSGGLLGSIRSTFRSLVLWSANLEMSISPQSYTHRQFLAGVRLLGAPRVMTEFIEELKLQSEAGSGPLALDIAATFICSPLAESFAVDQHAYQQSRQQRKQQQQQQQQTVPAQSQSGGDNSLRPECPILTPRDALALQHQDIPQIAERDPLRAQVIVRLYRRVNALLATPSPHAPDLDLVDVDIMESLNNFADNATASGGEANPQQPTDNSANNDNNGLAQSGIDITGMDMNALPGQEVPDENDPEHISRILDKAVAGMDVDNELGLGDGAGFGTTDTGITAVDEMDPEASTGGLDIAGFDDVLNATDMVVGNPEFLDLDMEGMF